MLHCSLLLLAWGVFSKLPSVLGFVLALAATLCLTATAKAEEAENIRYFGAAFLEGFEFLDDCFG